MDSICPPPTRMTEFTLQPNFFDNTPFANLPDTYELVRRIFSFINEPQDCKSLMLTCRTFLKLEFESGAMHIYTLANLWFAIRVNSCETVRHFLYHLKKDLDFDHGRISSHLVDKYSEMLIEFGKSPKEEAVVNTLQNILEEANEPVLIMKLGASLQYLTANVNKNKNIIQMILDGNETQVDQLDAYLQLQVIGPKNGGSSISGFIRDKWGGLLSLLQKHSTIFTVTGSSPKFMVSLNTQTTDVPPSLCIPLSKEMMLLTRYKTIPCQHFESNLQCPHNSCNFAHGDRERRRNPMSPFFIAYGSTLCPDREENGDNCIHGKSCASSCNQMEFNYHPENYCTSLCKTVVTRRPCEISSVCCYAHNNHQLRLKSAPAKQLGSMAHCARDQQWDKVKELVGKLPPQSIELISNDVYPYSKETVLHYAAKYCRPDVITLLLNNSPKLDVNQKDSFGQTPLHKAAAFAGGGDPGSNWQATLEKLIEHGADPCIKDSEGHDAFYFAKKNVATFYLRNELSQKLRGLAESFLNKKIILEETTEAEIPETRDFNSI
jgi:hypothetical protein